MSKAVGPKPSDLAAEIGKRSKFTSLRQEAYLNLLRTHSSLASEFSRLYKKNGLTDSKYNALRILQGEGKAMQVYQIAERMVTPRTDVTRLVDRLAADGYVERVRCEMDRRVVWVTLSSKGKVILRKLEKPVNELHEKQFVSFSNHELETLNKLLFKARTK